MHHTETIKTWQFTGKSQAKLSYIPGEKYHFPSPLYILLPTEQVKDTFFKQRNPK